MSDDIMVSALDDDGDIRLGDGRTLRMAGLDWPAADQKAARMQLRQALQAQFSAGRVQAETSGGKDRWGRVAAQLFVVAPQGDPPLWVQGRVLADGLAVAWPESAAHACWPAALAAEDAARRRGAGLWADADIRADGSVMLRPRGDSPMSRHVVFESVVTSVRPGRRVTFVNFAGARDKAPSLMLSARQMRDFVGAGRDPATFVGKRLRLRAESDFAARPRLSVIGPQAIEVVE